MAASSTMARVPVDVHAEITEIANEKGVTFGEAMQVWRERKSDDTETDSQPLTTIETGETRGFTWGERQILAGITGLVAGQSVIAEQVGATRHASALMSATQKALEASEFSSDDAEFIHKQVSRVVMPDLPVLSTEADELPDVSEFTEDEDDENKVSWWG